VDGSHNASKVTAATNHDTFAEIDAADLGALIAALPEYAGGGAKFFCSQKAWGLVFARLMSQAGGNSITDLAGEVRKSYLGHEVVVSQVLPAVTTSLTGLPMILFGNLRQAARFGDRRAIRVEILTERYADYDQIGIKATERFDIVASDLGNNTAAGPMVALIGA